MFKGMRLFLNICHVILYTQFFIKYSFEMDDKEKHQSFSNKRGKEFDTADDTIMIDRYKTYLNSPNIVMDGMVWSENDIFEGEKNAFGPFLIQTTNWHLKHLASELLEEALKIANGAKKVENGSSSNTAQLSTTISKYVEDRAKLFASEAIEKLVKERHKMEQQKGDAKTEDGIVGIKKTLCYRYNFVARILSVVNNWTTDKRAWEEIKDKKRISKLVEIEVLSWAHSQQKTTVDFWMYWQCDDVAVFDRLSAALIGNEHKMRTVHAENVLRILQKSPHFRAFLSAKRTDDFETNVKPRLEQLVGTEELIRLEDQFPALLRIEVMTRLEVFENYEQILSMESNSEENVLKLIRKLNAMVIGIMRENESQFKKQHAKNGKLQEIYERKMKELLDDAFGNLYSRVTLGEMAKFVNLTQSKKSPKQLETELRKWETGRSETEETQQALNEFREKVLNGRFMAEIMALLEDTSAERAPMVQVLAKNGAKSLLLQLIGWERFKELDDGNRLLGIFPSNGYQNDEMLWYHYKKALVNKKSSTVSIKNRMSADLIVFIRWLHRQLVDDEQINMRLLWTQMHKCFELEYDKLFTAEDDQLTTILEIEGKLGEMLVETHNFIRKEIFEKQFKEVPKVVEQQLTMKWEKKMDKCQPSKSGKMVKKAGTNNNIGQYYEKQKFIMSKLHQKEMLVLFVQDKFLTPFSEIFAKTKFERLEQFVDLEEFYKKWEIAYEKMQPIGRRTNLEINERSKGEQKQQQMGNNNISKQKENDEQKGEAEEEEEEKEEEEEEEEEEEDEPFGCPNKSKTREQLAAIDKANGVEEYLLTSFFEYFKSTNSVREEECIQIELDTMAWYYGHLLKTLKNILGIKENGTSLKEKSREMSICLNYIAFEYLTKRYKQTIGQQNRGAGSLHDIQFIDEQVIAGPKEQFYGWSHRNCSNAQFVATVRHSLCANKDRVRDTTAAAIQHLMEHSQQFRAFFCNLTSPSELFMGRIYDSKFIFSGGQNSTCMKVTKMGEAKEKVAQLISDNDFLLLEERFPDVFKIDSLLLKPLKFLYTNILKHKSHAVEAKLFTVRIGIPFYVQRVTAKMIETVLSKRFSLGIKRAFQTKYREILRDAFKRLAHRQFYGGMGNILCSLGQFLMKLHIVSLNLEEESRRIKQIEEWVPDCMENGKQDQAYQLMKSDLADVNRTQLGTFIKTDGSFKMFLRNTRGAVSRIMNLVREKKELEQFMDFCGEDILNEEVLTDEWLLNLYLEFLNNFDTFDVETKLAHILALSYSVWVRWMDTMVGPQNANLPFGLRQIYEQIWAKKRAYFVSVASDDVFNKDFDSMMGELALILDAFNELKRFVEERKQNGGKSPAKFRSKKMPKGPSGSRDMNLVEEWEMIWVSASRRFNQHILTSATAAATTEEWQRSTECQEEKFKNLKLTEWVQTLHFDALIELLGHKEMRTQFKHYLKKRVKFIENWLLHFTNKEMVEKIKKLVLSDEEQFSEMRANEKGKRRGTEVDEEKMKIYEEKLKEFQKELEEEEKAEKKKKEKKAKKKTPKKIGTKKGWESEQQKTMVGKSGEEKNLTNNQKALGQEKGEERNELEEEGEEEEGDTGMGWTTSETMEEEQQQSDKDAIVENDNADDDDGEEEEEGEGKRASGEHIVLNDFLHDNFLMTKYEKFLEEPTEPRRKFLDIGIYLHEISNRITAAEEMNRVIPSKFEEEAEIELMGKEGQKQLEEIKQQWDEMLGKGATKTKMSRTERQNLKKNLQEILKQIVFAMEGIKSDEIGKMKIEKSSGGDEKEMKRVKYQLHRNKLASTIATNGGTGKSGQIWANLDTEKRAHLLIVLFEKDTRKRATSASLVDQFRAHLEGWKKMLAQQRIDRISTNEYTNYRQNRTMTNGGTEHVGHPHSSSAVVLPQLTQQLFFNENNDERHSKELEQIILNENNNYYLGTEHANKALNELKTIVSNWSRGKAKLLETGSFVLGTNTATSDVDTICIMPQTTTNEGGGGGAADFFGGTLVECDLAQRKCAGDSFFCILCQNENVKSLQKLPAAYIPVIKMTFLGVEFDILFVAIPTLNDNHPNNLTMNEPITQNDAMALLQTLAKQTEPDEKTIKTLAGYTTNWHIKRLFGEKMLQKFKKLVILLKLWAKSNYIYGTLFGFFNGISLSIMAAKVSLLYPNASVPFLLNKFFLTFITWDWPVPLRVEEYVPNELFQQFSWAPKDEERKRNSSLLMPIITPGCLEQNGMYHMNKSTFKIVQKSMREAFLKGRQIQQKIQQSSAAVAADDGTNWTQFFPLAQFTKKYKYYAAICCIVANSHNLGQFCGFVQRKIRLQLLHFDEVTAGVNFTHISQGENDGGHFICPNSILTPVLKQNRHLSTQHKAWLVGIELEGSAEIGHNAREWVENYLNIKLFEEFDKAIMSNYYSKTLNGYSPAIFLVSKCVDVTELDGGLNIGG